MHVLGFSILACILAICSTAAKGETCRKIEGKLEVTAQVMSGRGCVGEWPGHAQLCAPHGSEIETAAIGPVKTRNALILKQANQIAQDKKCASFYLSIRPADHRNAGVLGYRCSPGTADASTEICVRSAPPQ